MADACGHLPDSQSGGRDWPPDGAGGLVEVAERSRHVFDTADPAGDLGR